LSRFAGENGMKTGIAKESPDISSARQRQESALQSAILQWLPERQNRAGLRISLIGMYSGD
jgi:hypothetical protein